MGNDLPFSLQAAQIAVGSTSGALVPKSESYMFLLSILLQISQIFMRK